MHLADAVSAVTVDDEQRHPERVGGRPVLSRAHETSVSRFPGTIAFRPSYGRTRWPGWAGGRRRTGRRPPTPKVHAGHRPTVQGGTTVDETRSPPSGRSRHPDAVDDHVVDRERRFPETAVPLNVGTAPEERMMSSRPRRGQGGGPAVARTACVHADDFAGRLHGVRFRRGLARMIL